MACYSSSGLPNRSEQFFRFSLVCSAFLRHFVSMFLVMKKLPKAVSVSIVIPVYNEQDYIKQCLDSIKNQTIAPDEVIVVDNNCTDDTIKIAKTFSFVKVASENRQGMAYARTAGFNIATSDVLGRINAKCVLYPDWTKRVIENFSSDKSLCGITGPASATTIPKITTFRTTLWSRVYFWMITGYLETPIMWGANMAIRRNVWLKIRDKSCQNDKLVHEDQDLSLLIAGIGGKIKQDNKLLLISKTQDYIFWPKYHWYFKLRVLTKRRHQKMGTYKSPVFPRVNIVIRLRGRFLRVFAGYPVEFFALVLYPFDLLLSKLKN